MGYLFEISVFNKVLYYIYLRFLIFVRKFKGRRENYFWKLFFKVIILFKLIVILNKKFEIFKNMYIFFDGIILFLEFILK